MKKAAGRAHADLAHKAKERKLGAREQFEDPSPVKLGAQSKGSVDTRCVLTWKEVDGVKTVKARLVAKGYQDPDLCEGDVDIAGRVGRRSSHLQLISLGALKTLPHWSLDSKNAFPRADGFGR